MNNNPQNVFAFQSKRKDVLLKTQVRLDQNSFTF
jgi:hypothetical protein